ncbi:MAG TPA: phosphatidylglycerophosphatase A [Polyangiaceae bacterium]|nr:phosphatidylglycerophosphatase A [Polyangiaceae bacterium]
MPAHFVRTVLPGDEAAKWIATWFGCGRSPIAPGTVGTLGTLPLYWAMRSLGPLPYAAITLALTAIGTWAAERTAQALGDEDPSAVVIDEVAGTLIALGFARAGGLPAELLSVVLFRFFDIKKPGPIDSVQHLKPAGAGIMADDLLAGFAAGLSVRALRWLLP